MKPTTSQDRAAALGQIFRGIVHETSNTLNVILMNAQLAAVSEEDVQPSLRIITEQARAGGEFLKQLSAFAGSTSFEPHTTSSIAECVALSRRLLGSTTRRFGTRLEIGDCDTSPRRLDTTGLAVTLTLMIIELCERAAEEIHIDSSGVDSVAINIRATGVAWPLPEQSEALALRLVAQLCRDHDGALNSTEQSWTLQLGDG